MFRKTIENILATTNQTKLSGHFKKNKFDPSYIHASAQIERFEKILSENLDDTNLAKRIEEELSNHWTSVRDSCLSYTALPQHYLTTCCVDLAKALHSFDSSKTDLNYLMPGVTKLWQPTMVTRKNNQLVAIESRETNEDITNLELNDAPLDQIIFSADGNKIIPVNTLRQLPYHYLHWHMQHDPDLQSQNTIDRLKTHSKMTRYWLDAYYELESANTSNRTLKEALQQLAADLKEGAIYAEGEETSAGTTAFVGVARFMSLFNKLSSEQQKLLLQLNDGIESLKNVIHNLTKGGSESDISLCVHGIYEDIESILRDNPNSEILNTKCALGIEEAEKNFSDLKLKSNQPRESGSDNYKIYPAELIRTISTSHIKSVWDLYIFFYNIKASLEYSPLSYSIELYKDLILRFSSAEDLLNHLPDDDDDRRISEIIVNILFIEKPNIINKDLFAKFFHYVTKENRLLFIKNQEQYWLTFIEETTPWQFKNLTRHLTSQEIDLFFNAYINSKNLNDFDANSLKYILYRLNQTQRDFVFDNYIKNRANELIKSTKDLYSLLPFLTPEQRSFIYEENKGKFSAFIKNKELDFFSNLQYFNQQQRTEIFELSFNDNLQISSYNLFSLLKYMDKEDFPKYFTPSIIKNLHLLLMEEWTWVRLNRIPEDKLTCFMKLVSDTDSNVIRYSIIKLSTLKSQENFQLILNGIKDQLPSVITSFNDLKQVLPLIPTSTINILCEALGEHLHALVPDYRSLNEILSQFNDYSSYSKICDIFKDKLPGIDFLKELIQLKLTINSNNSFYRNFENIFSKRIIRLDNNLNIENDIKICKNIVNFSCKFTLANANQETINDMKKFRDNAVLAVLDNEKSYPALEKQLKNVAKKCFEHRDYGKRVTADVLQFITGLFIFIIPVKWCLGQSAFFSHDKTNRQKEFEKEILNNPAVLSR